MIEIIFAIIMSVVLTALVMWAWMMLTYGPYQRERKPLTNAEARGIRATTMTNERKTQ